MLVMLSSKMFYLTTLLNTLNLLLPLRLINIYLEMKNYCKSKLKVGLWF